MEPIFHKGDRVQVISGGAYAGERGTVHDCDAPDVTIACTTTPRTPMAAVVLDNYPTSPPIAVVHLRRIPRCEMHEGCTHAVTHVDAKGYVYCEAHAKQRSGGGSGVSTRKLRTVELLKLAAGEPLGRKPKGAPTSLNLWVLKKHFEGRAVAPARVEAVDFQHLKRCLDAGLAAVDRATMTMTLTDAGKAAVAKERAR